LSWKDDDTGAIKALQEAVRIEPQSLNTRLQLGAAQRRLAATEQRIGENDEAKKNLDDAEKTLTDLIDDAPNVSAVHAELGGVYIQKQDLQDALIEWQKAIQLDPTDTSVLLNFGALLDSNGKPELAAKQFLAATLVDPGLVQAHLYLAHVYTKLNHRHDAVMQLTQAVALDPNSAAARNALLKAEEDEKKNGPGTPAISQPTSESSSQPMSEVIHDAATQPATP